MYGEGEGRREGRGFGGRRRFGGDYNSPKPVAAGDDVELTIESEGSQGDGIAKKDGFVIFVKGAKKGETCRAKINEVKRTFATAEKIG